LLHSITLQVGCVQTVDYLSYSTSDKSSVATELKLMFDKPVFFRIN